MGVTHRTLLIVASATLVVLASCDVTSTPQGVQSPEPTGPQPLPSPTAFDQVAPSPDARGRYAVKPVSAPVEVGVPYRFDLFTRCGLDVLVDFNGALWVTVDPAGSYESGPPKGFDSPRDAGVMTLVNQELAEFESSQGKTVRFIRDPGTKKIKACPDLEG